MKPDIEPDTESSFYPVSIQREDVDGLIFLTCRELPEFFMALKSADEIRASVEEGLECAFDGNASTIRVYTNGHIGGPLIKAVVRVTN